MKTPVVFLVFNRPDTTKKVFEAIRQAQPKQLLVVADGARPDKPGEAERCAATRSIAENVDWDCQVLTNYSEVNLGCRKRVSSGLNWAFSLVEEAIILEDDCLPDPTFFKFCAELLSKYRHDERVMAINGSNWLKKWQPKTQSYHFSNFFSPWGWASWRRTWNLYDVNMSLWQDPSVQQKIKEFIDDDRQFTRIKRDFDIATQNLARYNTWAYQFQFMCFMHSGSIVVPSVNLVSNMGSGREATHTKATKDIRINLPTYPVSFPLVPPAQTTFDRQFMTEVYRRVWDSRLSSRILRKMAFLGL